jgi:hypothetical protein
MHAEQAQCQPTHRLTEAHKCTSQKTQCQSNRKRNGAKKSRASHPSPSSNQRISNPNPNNPPLPIPPLNTNTPHIPHNPIRARSPQLLNPMRSRQRHNPKPSILARPHARRSVFQHQEFLSLRLLTILSISTNSEPKPLRPQAITSRIRFPHRDFLGRHHEARVRQFHHV